MKKLKITFSTSDGKRHTFCPHVDKYLTDEEIKAVLQEFMKLDQQEAAGERQFAKIEKVVWVEKITVPVFRVYRNGLIKYKPQRKDR